MTISSIYHELKIIISYNEAKEIFEKEYNELKILGQIERENIEKEYTKLIKECNLTNEFNDYITKRLIGIRYDTSKYSDLTSIKKEIIIANAILPDDISIINLLHDNGFTIEHLKVIIRFRSILKNKITCKTKNIDKYLAEQIKIYKTVVSKLIEIFETNFKINDSTIILNRITELLVTSPNLFDEKIDDNKLTKSPK